MCVDILIGMFQLVHSAENLVLVVLHDMLYFEISWDNALDIRQQQLMQSIWHYEPIETSLMIVSELQHAHGEQSLSFYEAKPTTATMAFLMTCYRYRYIPKNFIRGFLRFLV